mmetsp:Transcript_24977/g.48749  ORF Transcript_24977/g.48749 Transcript_24977/m.48749 type:complete len:247 (+) Transcript_24977:106-846(+)
MSLLASETQTKIAACEAALAAVETQLEPLLVRNPSEVSRKLPPLEMAELQVSMAYAVASIYYCHLFTQGMNPADHPLKQELDRIQTYFKKVRVATNEIATRVAEKAHTQLDSEEVDKITRHYTAVATAAEQRKRVAAAADSTQVLPAPQPVAMEVALAGLPRKKRRKMKRQSDGPMDPAPDDAGTAQAAIEVTGAAGSLVECSVRTQAEVVVAEEPCAVQKVKKAKKKAKRGRMPVAVVAGMEEAQ